MGNFRLSAYFGIIGICSSGMALGQDPEPLYSWTWTVEGLSGESKTEGWAQDGSGFVHTAGQAWATFSSTNAPYKTGITGVTGTFTVSFDLKGYTGGDSPANNTNVWTLYSDNVTGGTLDHSIRLQFESNGQLNLRYKNFGGSGVDNHVNTNITATQLASTEWTGISIVSDTATQTLTVYVNGLQAAQVENWNPTAGFTGSQFGKPLGGTVEGAAGMAGSMDINNIRFYTQAVVPQVVTAELVWAGNDNAGTWTVTAQTPSPWQGDLQFENNKSVSFGDIAGNATQNVTIQGAVNPSEITVAANNTDYVWASSATGGDNGLTGAAALTKSGAATLSIQADNTNYTGAVTLNGGVLELAHANALGNRGTITFAGGTLRYGTGISTDLSSRIAVNNGAGITVDTNGNNVTWATADTYTAHALTKLGEGTLTVNQATYSGTLTVQAGTLKLAEGSTQVQLNGAINVTQNATLNITSSGTDNGTNNNPPYPVVIAGAMTGEGAVELSDTQHGSRFHITGDNSNFTGTLKLTGTLNIGNSWGNETSHDVNFANPNAMGAGTIILNGRGFYLNNANAVGSPVRANLQIDSGGTYLNGSSGATYYMAGNVSGSGAWSTKLGSSYAGVAGSLIFTGGMSEFTGTFTRHQTNGTFVYQFGNNSQASLGADGQVFGEGTVLQGQGNTRYKFAYTDERVIMNATVGASGNNNTLEQAGAGVLVLTQDNPSTGALTVTSGTVQLGDGGTTGQWKGAIGGAGNLIVNRSMAADVLELAAANTYGGGTEVTSGKVKALGATSFGTGTITVGGGSQVDLNNQAVANTITVTQGSLLNAGGYVTAQGVTVNAAANAGDIALGGLDGGKISSLTTANAGTSITGIAGNLTLDGDNNLWINEQNTDYNNQTAKALIQFDDTASVLSLGTPGLTLHLHLAADILAAMREQDSVHIALTNGTIGGAPFPTESRELNEWVNSRIVFDNTLSSMGFLVTGIEGGNLVISGNTDAIYIASEDGVRVNSLVQLNPYEQVIVDRNLELDLTVPQGNTEASVIKQLQSNGNTATGDLIIAATGQGSLDVELQNNEADSTFNGNTVVGGDHSVDLVKTGEHTLTLAGNVSTPYAVIAQEGALNLNGTHNEIGTLSLESTDGAAPARVSIGGTTEVQQMTEGANAGALVVNGTLSASGNSTLANTVLSGTGTLNVQQNAALSVQQSSEFTGTLDVEGALSLGTEATATTHGAKTLEGGANATLALNNSTLTLNGTNTATFAGHLNGNGTLVIDGSTRQTLQGSGEQNALQVGSSATLLLQGGADMAYRELATQGTLHLNANEGTNTVLHVADGIVFSDGSNTEFVYNLDDAGTVRVQAGSITIEETAQFRLSTLTSNNTLGDMQSLIDGEGKVIMSTAPAIATFAARAAVAAATAPGITGLDDERAVSLDGLFHTYFSDAKIVKEGGDVVLYATERSDNLFAPFAESDNALAGADLIWDTRRGNIDSTDARAQVMEALSAMTQSDTPDRGEINRLLAAAAGSTTPVLGTAQRVAMGEQMLRMRNKMTAMGTDQLLLHEDYPHVHMWIEGTGGYTDVQSKGDEAGYRLDTWGGSVGFDTDLNDRWTLGAALAVEYGDLNAQGAESADGELNGYYLNLFARYKNDRFAHSVMVTGGVFNASLDRTVQFGTGGYTASGSTDGQGLGVMYELTYDTYLTDDRDVILQPLLNVSFLTTSMDAYTESGAGNAGLHVGKQDWSTGTAALGLRLTGTLGSNLFGRPVMGELRANVAQDMGDDRGEADVAFADAPLVPQSVRGVKVGSTGVQLGVGLHMPVGTQSAVFVHGNADVRSGRNSYGAALGWRYDF